MSTQHLQGALSHSADVSFLFQSLEMAEDAVGGGDLEPAGYFLDGRGVALFLDGPNQEIVDQFLPVSKSR